MISDREIRHKNLILQLMTRYDPNCVSTVISPNDTMAAGDNYMWVGASAAEVITTAIMASRMTEVNRVLDIPCGHGRVLRHIIKMFPEAQVDVCDVDQEGVNFCVEEFGVREVVSNEDLTLTRFDTKYDLIWIGSLFTHFSEKRTREGLEFLSRYLTPTGIIVSTFHGRWALKMHDIAPYIDGERWNLVLDGYHSGGYGYVDYPVGNGHDFIEGSYGLSAARPEKLMAMVTQIPGTRVFLYREKGWGDNHDVIAFGKPDWADPPSP